MHGPNNSHRHALIQPTKPVLVEEQLIRLKLVSAMCLYMRSESKVMPFNDERLLSALMNRTLRDYHYIIFLHVHTNNYNSHQ